MKLAVAAYATTGYFYAWDQCLKHISAAVASYPEGDFIFVTDTSAESKQAEEAAGTLLPDGWRVHAIRMDLPADHGKTYSTAMQLKLASMQDAAFHFARSKIRPDYLLSVEADVLIPPHAARVLEWALKMPQEDGSPYYEVAAGTYPNALFLGGFGSPSNPIAEDFLPHERTLSPRLKMMIAECERRIASAESQSAPEKEHRRLHRLRDRAKKCPPEGNIWEVTAKHGWRRRGWMDFAYPGIGKGALVPSDWCGLGCTMLSARALSLASFNGYDGHGTQDLFICWKKWHPAGIRIACVPHVICDHVKKREGKPEHLIAYHEQQGESRGHLRVNSQSWIPL